MGQILTKIAIVISGMIFCAFNPIFGLVFIVAGLVTSIRRDVKLARRRQLRMLPGFGAVWFLAFGIVAGLFTLILAIGGRPPMAGGAGPFLGITLVAILVRVICILVEGGVRGLMELLLSPFMVWDNIALDEAQRQMDNGTWGQVTANPGVYPPHYTGPQNWEWKCPICGAKAQFSIDVCWRCNYGAVQPPMPSGPLPPTQPVNPRAGVP